MPSSTYLLFFLLPSILQNQINISTFLGAHPPTSRPPTPGQVNDEGDAVRRAQAAAVHLAQARSLADYGRIYPRRMHFVRLKDAFRRSLLRYG